MATNLVLSVLGQETVVGRRADGKEVWRQRAQDLAVVAGDDVESVRVRHAVRVYRHQYRALKQEKEIIFSWTWYLIVIIQDTYISVDVVIVVADAQVPEDGCLVEVGQSDHIVDTILPQILAALHLPTAIRD